MKRQTSHTRVTFLPPFKIINNNNSQNVQIHVTLCKIILYTVIQITYLAIRNIIRENISTLSEYLVLLSKSAPAFSFPGMSSTLKEYSWTATEHLNTWSFWYAASFRYLKGLWSFYSVNLPARYSLNLLIPHNTARHSFSIIGYLASVRFNFLLAWPIG